MLALERLEHRFPFDAAAPLSDLWEEEAAEVHVPVSAAEVNVLEEADFAAPWVGMKLTLDIPIERLDASETTITGMSPGDDSKAEAAALADGSHMFVFAGNLEGQDGILVRRTRPDGSPNGPPTLVAALDPNELHAPDSPVQLSLAAFDGTRAVVAWTDSTGIHLQRIDQDGAATGASIDINTTTTPIDYTVDLIGLEAGGWMLVWWENASTNIQFQRFDSNGNIVGESFSIASTTPLGHIEDVRLLPHVTNDFAISWIQSTADPAASIEQQFLGILQVDGTWASAPLDISDATFAPTLEIVALDAGRWVLLGERSSESETYPAVIVIDASGDLISEYAINTSTLVDETSVSLIGIDGGGFAVGYFSGDWEHPATMVVQQFNDASEPVGEPIVLNETPLRDPPVGAIVGLADGGIAGYWIGTGIDQTSPAALSRTVRMESVGIDVEFAPWVPLEDAASLMITGVPPAASLSHGVRMSSTSWSVSLNDLAALRLLSFEPLPVVTLNADLLGTDPSQPPIASWAITTGTLFDDVIEESHAAYVVDGRSGNDTFLVAGVQQDFALFDDGSNAPARLVHKPSGLERLLIDIEFLAFEDSYVEIEQWNPLADASEESPEPGTNDWEQESWTMIAQSNPYAGGNRQTVAALPHAEMANTVPSMASAREAMNTIFAEMGMTQGMAMQGVMQGMEKSVRDMNEPARVAQNKAASNDAKPRTAESKAGPADKGNPEDPAAAGAAAAPRNAPAASTENGIADPLPVPNLAPLQTFHPIQPQPFAQHTFNNPVAAARSLYRSSGPAIAHVDAAAADTGAAAAPEAPPAAAVPMPFTSPILAMPTAFDSAQLFAKIDEVEQEVAQDAEAIELVAGSAVVLATGFSLAQVAWLLRGSVLLTKLMSSMPIWVSFDPLPVLSENWDRLSTASSCDHESLLDIASGQKPTEPA
ncbi:hypothetical protein Poly24_14760 [Rosistilla carotiformis]|uniref:Uncharacterized protein n=2 Tax=Rosistilla carotiformis TaxID=2528017 RepID=A0A518JQF6_9BACT|nr:hypothetical protein Poly24_14760 [Rosistilla carotiformis]